MMQSFYRLRLVTIAWLIAGLLVLSMSPTAYGHHGSMSSKIRKPSAPALPMMPVLPATRQDSTPITMI